MDHEEVIDTTDIILILIHVCSIDLSADNFGTWRKTYHNMALKYHSDKNHVLPYATLFMQKLNGANSYLKNLSSEGYHAFIVDNRHLAYTMSFYDFIRYRDLENAINSHTQSLSNLVQDKDEELHCKREAIKLLNNLQNEAKAQKDEMELEINRLRRRLIEEQEESARLQAQLEELQKTQSTNQHQAKTSTSSNFDEYVNDAPSTSRQMYNSGTSREGDVDYGNCYSTYQGSTRPTHDTSSTSTNNIRCSFCDRNHYSASCENVTRRDERLSILNYWRLCHNCLGFHPTPKCQSTKRCRALTDSTT
ncbi:unnamed protein product [Bursaphelenchus okinawaensis]|uniref:J domain-containing protein n=1 Tax=Bursaphelenchus okinawaensis TaxID=465554 RepID=A0A811KDH5_9BILA|nr:unnamed protein product [Bursaphelenchus okinawaensis]CAG9101676.1 unnamed protein product [Bursaphelenchus okinawaensis]